MLLHQHTNQTCLEGAKGLLLLLLLLWSVHVDFAYIIPQLLHPHCKPKVLC